jgi:predicted transcriptional regulator
MTLQQYMAARAVSPGKFAKLIGVSRQTVHRYLAGESIPAPPIMRRIYAQTDGQVSANDFYELPNAA